MTYPGDSALASDVQQRILTTFQQTLELATQGNKQEALLGCDFILRLDPDFKPARTLQQMVNSNRSGAELASLFGGAPGAQGSASSNSEADPYVQAFLESARQALAAGDSAEADRLVRKAKALEAGHPAIAQFEQERGGGSDDLLAMGSFDLPEVDFSGAADGTFLSEPAPSGDGGGRIRELLSEGQSAFERGEFQGAIDAWSRIFLIDIDHHEAARRIEEARRLKAEREREVEELFHGGVSQFDSADFAGAESSFRRVLDISPGYVLAQEYLEKIAERRSGGPVVGASLTPPAPAGAARAASEGGAEAGRAGRAAREKSQSEILVPPDPGAARKSRDDRPAFAVAAKKKGGASNRFALIGGGVLVLLLVGGWLLLRNRAALFPNAKSGAENPANAPAADPIARAQALHADGKTAIAVAQLRRIPPQDAAYAEAQSLVAQWEALVRPAEPVAAGLVPELKAKRDGLVAGAERACQDGENLRCRRALEQAATIQALEPRLETLLASARQNLTPLEADLKMFGDGEYEATLNRLWRAREAEPQNRDVRQLIVDSYFNLGVLELQRGDAAAAADRFREARELDDVDPELERLESFALTYTQRAEDLLFQIFVRNLVNR